jgi:hypothetical protein
MPEYIYLQPVVYQVDSAEILRDYGERPHLLLRVAIRGGYFPHRDAAAFARIESAQRKYEALAVEIDEDQAGLRAYFPTDIPVRAGTLKVGYDNQVVAEFALGRLKLEPVRLEVARIEAPFHRVTARNLGAFRAVS